MTDVKYTCIFSYSLVFIINPTVTDWHIVAGKFRHLCSRCKVFFRERRVLHPQNLGCKNKGRLASVCWLLVVGYWLLSIIFNPKATPNVFVSESSTYKLNIEYRWLCIQRQKKRLPKEPQV